jgi:hypothetical protein
MAMPAVKGMATAAVTGMAIAGAIDGVPDASDLINPTFHPPAPNSHLGPTYVMAECAKKFSKAPSSTAELKIRQFRFVLSQL